MRLRRELLPVGYIRFWGTKFLVAARDELKNGPSELRDDLAAERDPVACEAIVRRWVDRVLRKFYECEKLWNPPLEDDVA
jgi:hypothetical protein